MIAFHYKPSTFPKVVPYIYTKDLYSCDTLVDIG